MKKITLIGTIILACIFLILPLEETMADERQGKIYGNVYISTTDGEKIVEEGIILLEGEDLRMETRINKGYYEFTNLTEGEYTVYCSVTSCEKNYKTIVLDETNNEINLDFFLSEESSYNMYNAKVYGTIKDAKTNKSIESAFITIYSNIVYEVDDIYSSRFYPSNYNSTYTDRNGYYEMNCWSGENYVTVYADGYKDYSLTTLLNESEVKQIDIQLVPKPPKNVRVHGGIYDRETNQPVKGAYISLNNYEYMEWQSNQTDEQGYFDLWVYEGYSALQVWAEGYNSYDTTYSLMKNESIELDIYLKPQLQPDCILHGYIINESGSPVKDVWINAWNQELYAYGNNMTDEDGYFEIMLIHGYYTINTNVYGYYPYITNAEIDGGERLEITITLKEGYNNFYYTRSSAESMDQWEDTVAPNENLGTFNPPSDGEGTQINQHVKLAIGAEKSPGFEFIAILSAVFVIMFLMKRRLSNS